VTVDTVDVFLNLFKFIRRSDIHRTFLPNVSLTAGIPPEKPSYVSETVPGLYRYVWCRIFKEYVIVRS